MPLSPAAETGMMWGATQAGCHQRHVVAGEAGDTVDPRGLNSLGEGHRREDGDEEPCQHRLPRPRRAEQGTLWAERLHHVQVYLIGEHGSLIRILPS
jgi:hypothetical protein